LLQQTDIGFGVVCRRIDTSMSQHQTNAIERDTLAQHLGSSRVSQHVGTPGRPNDASTLHSATHHIRHAIATHKWPERGNASDEYVVALLPRAAPDVINDCVADLLRKRQPNLIASLARYTQRSRLPLDIAKQEAGDISGA
jgi:hypothetical protein